METTIWIAESENGSVMFDTPPSASDVRNCCEDLEHPIEVYAVTVRETDRELLFSIDDDKPKEPETFEKFLSDHLIIKHIGD